MRVHVINVVAVLLLAVVASASVDNQLCASSSTPSGTNFFPPSARLASNASSDGSASAFVDFVGFNVTYYDAFKVVRTKALIGTERTYVLYQCGTTAPTRDGDGSALPASAQFFSVPVTGVATGLTIAIGYLEQLGLRSKLKLVDPAGVHAPCVQKEEEEGRLLASHVFYNSDYSENRTYWRSALTTLGSAVDMVITDGYLDGTASSGTAKDVVFEASDSDLGMLQRTEMVKFLSLFFNKESEANAYYADQVERWTTVSNAIDSAHIRGDLPSSKCAWVSAYAGSFTVSWDQYKHDLCAASGLTTFIPSGASDGVSSYAYPNKTAFLSDMASVNVVIDESYFFNPSTSATKTAVLQNLAFDEVPTLPCLSASTGALLRTDKTVSDGDPLYTADNYYPAEGYTWYEDSFVHPAVVLQDLTRLAWRNKMSHISGIRAGCPRFFRDMIANEAVTKTTADDCSTWDHARTNGLCIQDLSNQAELTFAALLAVSGVTHVGVGVCASLLVAFTTILFA